MRQLALGAVLLAASVAWVPSISIAQKSTEGSVIDVDVHPALALNRIPVEISGSAGTPGKGATVGVRVEPPGLPAVTLKAPIDAAAGTYAIQYTLPDKAGTYHVTVTATDGKTTASTTFRSMGSAALASEFRRTLDLGVEVAFKGVTDMRSAAKALPPSAPRTQLEESAAQLEKRVADLTPMVLGSMKALGQALRAIELRPGALKPAAPHLEALGDWTDETDDDLERARKELDGAQNAPTDCDRLEYAREAFVTLSFSLNAIKTGAKLIAAILGDHLLAAEITAAPIDDPAADDAKSAWALANKAAVAAITPIVEGGEFYKGVSPLMIDIGQIIEKKIFAQYCVKFEGPVAATFNAKFYEGGKIWWAYGVRLDGKITLRYPKGGGSTVQLSGEIEGNAVQFAFEEDILLIERPPHGMVLVDRRKLLPVPFKSQAGDPYSLGLARMLTPSYFRIPVQGKRIGDRIVIELLPAKVDFSSAVQNRLLTIAVSPALPIPQFKVFEFPIRKAHYIITRGIQEPSPAFDIAVDGARTKINRRFEREHWNDAKDIKLNWVVKLEATSG